ncbi:hypothetical protein [Hymenobacter psoromatis]|uniref:hypothetical protein n=1 Tax=Hymenobacter psoromatis TaxID=1484116 RepID=UPI001CC11FE6|nr:hypothetical protein [Hymenobacter psoromatis]
MSSKPASVFTKLIGGFSICLLLCLFTLYRNQKTKNQFQHLTGTITALTKSLKIEGYSSPDKEPIRYLQIQDSLPIFRLFIGEDIDGSKPSFERVDELRAGDVVTVYYDKNYLNSNSDVVSNLAYFVDKGQQAYFIRGNKDNEVYYLISICLIVIAVSYFLKKAGKIS